MARSTTCSTSSPAARVVLVERNLVRMKAARGRAVEQSAAVHRLIESGLDRHRIQHRLQDRAAADDHLVDAIGLSPRLVVGQAEHLRLDVLLDQVDRAFQLEPARQGPPAPAAARVALARHVAKPELEVFRQPFGAVAGESIEPCPQVAANRGDLVGPDALDGRRELVVPAVRQGNDDGVEDIARARPETPR